MFSPCRAVETLTREFCPKGSFAVVLNFLILVVVALEDFWGAEQVDCGSQFLKSAIRFGIDLYWRSQYAGFAL
jgi:hypothetical protein